MKKEEIEEAVIKYQDLPLKTVCIPKKYLPAVVRVLKALAEEGHTVADTKEILKLSGEMIPIISDF